MAISWRREWPHIALLVALFIIAAIIWPQVPDRLPVHWDLAGEVDRYGGKVEGLLLIPLIAHGLYWLLLLLPFLDPRRENYARFAQAYAVIRWGLTLFLAGVYGLMLAVACGQPVDFSLGLGSLMGALFIALGLCLDSIEPNWFVGIRTPWTLSSAASWKQTHRHAKWVFLALGCACFLLGWYPTVWSLGVVLATGLGGVTWLVLYSYLVWRQDRRLPH